MVEGWVFSALLVAFLAFTTPFESFYLLGSYMHTYRQDEVIGAKQLKNVNEQICQICGDTVGFSATGDIFVVCNECAFPVCRSCYEYERKEGNQCCPQCKSRYKRHKGSPRVGEMRRMELMIWTMNETIHKAMSKGLSAAAGTRGRC